MKKLVIAVLAIGAMAACTKQNVQLEQPGEISIQPVAQKATKATSTSTVYPETEKFNVWAWWGDVEPAAISYNDYSAFSTLYLNAATFAENNGSWAGSDGTNHTPYYWPTSGSLVFAGYSPANATGTFSYKFDGTVNPKTKTFTAENFVQSNEIAKTVDLMWFDATPNSYKANPTGGVPAPFKHALSWLTFKFNLASGATADNWGITKVELKGIENMSTFTATNGAGEWSTPTHNNVDNNNDTDETNIVVYSATTATAPTADGVVLENTTNASEEVGAVLVIPQSCAAGTPAVGGTPAVPAAAELVITYNLKNPAGTPTHLVGQTVTLPLNGGTGAGAWNDWAPGKHYIYTITFGANEILIAPEVAAWTPVSHDINVQ